MFVGGCSDISIYSVVVGMVVAVVVGGKVDVVKGGRGGGGVKMVVVG